MGLATKVRAYIPAYPDISDIPAIINLSYNIEIMISLGDLKMAQRKRSKTRGGLAPDKYLSEAQLKKLRQYVKDKADIARMRGGSRGVIDELIVELLVNTGLRASELCGLNIGDLPVKHGKDCIWVRDGKGNVSRTVDISDKLKKRLE